MAIAELIRRRPARHVPVHPGTRMPGAWDDGLAGELTLQLAVSRRHAVHLLSFAWDLAVKLPRTSAMLRDGGIDEPEAAAAAAAFANLDLDQALTAEDLLYAHDDLPRRTLGTIRDRAARAAMEADPDVARRRREEARKDARVEVRAEDSGNASLTARELPPDTADAMNRLLTRRARQLRKAGIPGTLDELRIQAFLERFGHPSPLTGGGESDGGGPGGRGPKPGGGGPAGSGGAGAGSGSWAGPAARPAAAPGRGSTSPSPWPPSPIWPANPATCPAPDPSTPIPKQIHRIATRLDIGRRPDQDANMLLCAPLWTCLLL